MAVNPEISVIITNHNYGMFLCEAVDSVLDQTYKNFECIIADDGSEDGSRELIAEYMKKDARIKAVLLNGRNGQNEAFSKAAQIAGGDIICCLDSDDWYYPKMLEYKLEMHNAHPDCAMVDSSLSIDGTSRMVEAKGDFDFAEALCRYGYLYAHNTTSGLSIKKNYLEKFLPFSETDTMKAGLDCVLAHIALAGSNVAIDRRICGGYRVHAYEVYDEKKSNNEGAFHTYITALKRYARKQASGFGRLIPEDDALWYKKILEMVKYKISGKRVAVYGTSEIAKSVISELERAGGGKIVFVTDNPATRRSQEKNNSFIYEYIPADALNSTNGWDIVLIASRQRNAIHSYLADLGIEEEKIVELML